MSESQHVKSLWQQTHYQKHLILSDFHYALFSKQPTNMKFIENITNQRKKIYINRLRVQDNIFQKHQTD